MKSRRKTLEVCAEFLETRRFLAATGVIRSIEGMNFEQEGTLNGSPGFGTIPPSPQVAAGPGFIVSTSNSAIEFYTKSGTRTLQQNLFGFFQNQPFTELFDARPMFDEASQRWIIVALDWTDSTFSLFGNTSRIFFAVSDDADPNGDWAISQLNSKVQISSVATWADGLGAAIGNGALFLTTNQHRFGNSPIYQASRLWIVDLEQLLGGNLSFTVHDPFAATGLTAHAGGFQPTHIRSTNTDNVGTYLLGVNNYTDGGGNDQFALVSVRNALTTPIFTSQFVSMGGDVDNQAVPLPGAPQLGSAVTLVANDRRFSSAATWINGTLYAANTIVPNSGADAGQNTSRWYQVSVNGAGTAALLSAGNVGAENLGAGTHTFYPSIAADGDGNWAMTFAASSPSMFASSAYTTAIGNTVEVPAVFAAGQDYYVRTYISPPAQAQLNRWGDYTGIVHDPVDGTFWAANLYAGPRGGVFQTEDGRWRTRMANFAATNSPPRMGRPDVSATSDSGSSTTDNITNDNTPTITGETFGGALVTLFDGVAPIGTTTAGADGAWSITPLLPLLDGVHTITAVATNGFGASPPSRPLSLTIDTAAPLLNSAVFNFETGHSLTFNFSEPISNSVELSDFVVTNQTTASAISAANQLITFANAGATALLSFPGVAGPPAGILADGNYTAAIAASTITDTAGNALAASSTPFFVFAGDANRDRAININDFAILGARFNQPGTFSQGDFNYNGLTNISDFAILAAKFNTTLPASSPRTAVFSQSPLRNAASWQADDDEDLLSGRVL